MATFPSDLRPVLIGALLLGLSVVPWIGRPYKTERGAGSLVFLPPAAVVDVPPRDFLLVPPEHPDARPWPHGMVIRPPAVDGAMNLGLPAPWDKVLSGLLAAFGAGTS